MIEGADINDKDILDNSRQERNDNGTFRLKIKLPNGQELTSEWIAPENGRKAMKLWCDAVRQAWPAAVAEKAAEKGKAARLAQAAERRRKLDAIVDAPNTQAPQPPDAVQKAVDTVADPCEHAKQQVALLEAEERHWLAEYQRAERHLATTRDRLRKWKLIQASFDAGEKQ